VDTYGRGVVVVRNPGCRTCFSSWSNLDILEDRGSGEEGLGRVARLPCDNGRGRVDGDLEESKLFQWYFFKDS
jgi:hypothetical protein